MRDQRKRYALGYALEFAAFCLISALITLILMIPILSFSLPDRSERVEEVAKGLTVVIDAGHGGEDGGAIGHGLVEKDLNLEIALHLAELLEEKGISVVLTRDSDTLLYDKNDNYQGRKKALDLRRRLEITQSIENAVFVSIHMNYFAKEQYSGLQVYYSKQDPRSRTLAAIIQTRTKEELQPNNKRTVKEATSSIFLLDNLSCPAVLIECGFLSNAEEARALSNVEYREKLTDIIFKSIVDYILQNGS